MASKPKGYYSKGKVKSEKAVLRARYGDPTTLKGIAGIIGGAVLEGIGGPKAKGAKGAVRLGMRATEQLVNKSARGGRVMSRATNPSRNVRTLAKSPTIAKKKADITKQASGKLATRNRTQMSRAGDKVAISPASLGSKTRSGNPTPNRGGGLRTTTGRGKSKVTKADVFEAVRGMSKSPSGSSKVTGTGSIRGTAPKPDVRITTRTSGGRGIASRAQGPAKDPTFTAKITKRSEGPSNKITEKKTVRKGRIVRDVKVTKFEKPPVVSRTVTGERMPFKSTNTEKVTISKPVRRSTNKNGSAITIRKTTPRKAKDVRKERADRNSRRKSKLLTQAPKPLGPNRKLNFNKADDRTPNTPEKEQVQGITVRGRFYADGNPGPAARGQQPQGTIESRLTSRSEKPTRGRSDSNYDKEAEDRINEALSDKARPNATVKKGQRTKVARAIKGKNPKNKSANRAQIIRATQNMRRVLSDREIKEAAEAMARYNRGK